MNLLDLRKFIFVLSVMKLIALFLSIPFDKYYLSSEDYDWWIKILLADIKVIYIPESLVRYRIHNKNMTRKFLKIYFYNIKIFNKIIVKSVILFFFSVLIILVVLTILL